MSADKELKEFKELKELKAGAEGSGEQATIYEAKALAGTKIIASCKLTMAPKTPKTPKTPIKSKSKRKNQKLKLKLTEIITS